MEREVSVGECGQRQPHTQGAGKQRSREEVETLGKKNTWQVTPLAPSRCWALCFLFLFFNVVFLMSSGLLCLLLIQMPYQKVGFVIVIFFL